MHGYKWPINCTRARITAAAAVGGVSAEAAPLGPDGKPLTGKRSSLILRSNYTGAFPDNPQFRNHAPLIFTYILCARITDYLETHPYL